ncbi:Hypothetical predicted protein [Mytilus galloprovincialis]|uniref:Uncharacterized protein n=1 Tax=Mytilus galloprovincialis TaxID=29158 RepID=A0A8B6ELR7_MYTGA|nr:Hypothetical predicted protein [Mytilus galloprovincialis]
MDVTKKFHVTLINRFIMANQEKEKKSFSVSGFCEAILSTAEFECRLEDIQDMKAAEAKRTVWKLELKRENKEEKRSEKDVSMNIEEKGSENDESMNIEEKRSENDERMNIEEKKPEMGVDISTEQRREMIITKPIHVQRIGENPLKNAVGHANKDPVQNSESKGSIDDKETMKDEKKRKREIMKEEKLMEKKAKEEEKNVKAQYKAIDKGIKKYSKDVKSTWKKEEKRKAGMKKMGDKAQRMLEKEMRKIEKERRKDEKKKQVQAIDRVQENQNDLKIVKTNEETEKNEDEGKKTDQTINVDGGKQNDSEKTKKEAGIIKEKKNNFDVIERKEKEAKDIEMSTNNAGKTTTFAARISGFFRSLSCIKGQKKSKDVC